MFDSELLPGQRLGRYELLVPIARGGMGAVWAARLRGSHGFQKLVAVKTLLPGLSEDPDFERMFLDEARLASEIHHPHVVEILDLGEEREVLYLVMEWIDGEPLHRVIREAAKSGGIPLPLGLRIVGQMCRGLHAAHELRNEEGALLGLVHRDVSPQNVLVTFGGVAKLVDFGVAKTTQGSAGMTAPGHLKGKAGYMAPEQIRGDAIDRRTDVFATGALLYLMTTGQHPFKKDSDPATMSAVASSQPAAPPSSIVDGYPKALERVVLRALAKDPNQRFPTANALLEDLEEVLPPMRRARSDEIVASFVKTLLSDRRERRREALKRAIEELDTRGAITQVAPISIPDAGTTDRTKPTPAVEPQTGSGRTAAALTNNVTARTARGQWARGLLLASAGVLVFAIALVYVALKREAPAANATNPPRHAPTTPSALEPAIEPPRPAPVPSALSPEAGPTNTKRSPARTWRPRPKPIDPGF